MAKKKTTSGGTKNKFGRTKLPNKPKKQKRK